MTLIDMSVYRRRDIGAVLHQLLERYERGDIRALALCVKGATGCEEISFTGEYKSDSSRAQSASLKMYRRVSEIEDHPCGCC